MTAALEVRGITKMFGDFKAVQNVNFQVEHGQIMGFIGPNGAGKTTTMRICATLELPDAGDVFINGVSSLANPREVRQLVGFMPDSYGAYSNTTILEYLDFFARAYGLKGSRRRETVAQVMEFTSLQSMHAKEIASLSKGMKQRLCLAKTLLHDPSVLILDEPAAGLDPRARIELREVVKALAQTGKSILISSHILTELSEMCDSVAVIEKGILRATGSVQGVLQSIQSFMQIFVRTVEPREVTERTLRELPNIDNIRHDGAGLIFEYSGTEEELSQVLEILVSRGCKPVEFGQRSRNLEDLFLAMTEGKLQ